MESIQTSKEYRLICLLVRLFGDFRPYFQSCSGIIWESLWPCLRPYKIPRTDSRLVVGMANTLPAIQCSCFGNYNVKIFIRRWKGDESKAVIIYRLICINPRTVGQDSLRKLWVNFSPQNFLCFYSYEESCVLICFSLFSL